MKFNIFSLDRVPTIDSHPIVIREQPSQGIPTSAWHLVQIFLLSLPWVLLTGCPPDNTPILEENEQIKKQIVKQESILKTLQAGNRVLQEQIDLLNQELREKENKFAKQLELSQQTGQGLSTEKQNLLQHMTALTQENQKLQLESQKLKGDAQWLRKQREIFRQSLQANNQRVKVQKLPHKLPDVTKAALRALAQNGYTLMAKMETDQKSVFVTERKDSPSSSIELPGYRNQYLVELEVHPNNQTALKVKAQYEKMGQGGKILEVGDKEVTEIEHRFIQAIQQVLNQPKEKAKPKAIKKNNQPPL